VTRVLHVLILNVDGHCCQMCVGFIMAYRARHPVPFCHPDLKF
jgi:sulfite exporter TauE/SafE